MSKRKSPKEMLLKSMANATRKARRLINKEPMERSDTIGRKSPSSPIDFPTLSLESATANPMSHEELEDLIQCTSDIMDRASKMMNYFMQLEDARMIHDLAKHDANPTPFAFTQPVEERKEEPETVSLTRDDVPQF